MGQIYAVPYQVLEPDLAFVVEGPSGPAGYLLGAARHQGLQRPPGGRLVPASAAPGRRSRPRPVALARQRLGAPRRSIIPISTCRRAAALSLARPYRPAARGARQGHRPARHGFLEQRLAAAGSPGMFMQVDLRNRGALAFYDALGFAPLRHADLPAHSVYMAKRLATSSS